jgi:hypothetical protein
MLTLNHYDTDTGTREIIDYADSGMAREKMYEDLAALIEQEPSECYYVSEVEDV